MLGEEFLAVAGEEFYCPECDDLIHRDQVGRRRARFEDEVETEVERPPGTQLECRVIDRQLVIFIRPGSNRTVRSLGCFAVVWLGFMIVFTGLMVLAGPMAEADLTTLMFLIPFLGLFWAVGLVMLYFWIRGRFGRTYVLVEPDRLVLKTELFGRERYREHQLDANSRAQLEESYRQNDQPVYKVAVRTVGKSVGFGTFLGHDEKNWIVERVNRHLGREEDSAANDTPS